MACILLGVTGSIAAYKAAELASKLTQAGHEVTVLMTEAATRLVTPHTFRNLTGNHCYTDLWEASGQTEHIALTDRAELFVLAPATANALAKLAHGLADDMVHTTLLAVRCPVLVCPAMNTRMWENPVVQSNMRRVEQLGDDTHVLPPASGNLACGHVGAGRLREPAEILVAVERLLRGDALPTARLVPTAGAEGKLFLEILTLDAKPAAKSLEAEQEYREQARREGRVLAGGRLGSPGSHRYGYLHRAADLEQAMQRAREAPLARLKCQIEVFPWHTGDPLPFGG